MINQRGNDAAVVVRAVADFLPFASDSFDASLAVLSMHHWPDRRAGLAELVRVARRRTIVLTWDPTSEGFWLVQRYFTEILNIDRKSFSFLDQFRQFSKSVSVKTVPVPHDCQDGFLGAYWRRPEAYLDPLVRASISVFSKLKDIESRIQRLEDDLRSGAWDRDFGYLRSLSELDTGYRIVVLEKST
jgi:SAM-dependent methyltransferase